MTRQLTENAVVIGAHPDDELLWFTSVLPRAEKAIVVFKDYWADPTLGAKRAAALADYPHDNMVFLELAEAGSFGAADWANPEPDAYGLKFGSQAQLREAKRQAKSLLSTAGLSSSPRAPAPVRELYEQNHRDLKARLREELSAEMNVFTHNPWGEYGHEDHVLVHRVVSDLRDEIGFKLWMSNYCTPRSLPLARQYFQSLPVSYVRLKADIDYAEKVAALYKANDCWTWDDDWTWFEEECFMEAPSAPTGSGPFSHLFPLNMFDTP